MSDEKEKDKNGEKDTNASEAADLIKELGLLSTGSNFKSDIQYINIIGSIEGHSVLPQDTKTTKYEHLIPEMIAVEDRNPSGSLVGLFVCRKIRNDDTASDSHQWHADYRRADF